MSDYAQRYSDKIYCKFKEHDKCHEVQTSGFIKKCTKTLECLDATVYLHNLIKSGMHQTDLASFIGNPSREISLGGRHFQGSLL